ncbi:MAG TPA: NAD-dependent epimerase/dehydratase family protein [Candidatus Dormibacteraeota bacterium]|nr:NAD-dependent epimerase/dehydratase family protein [Candidatus Dormibacteraeota bacterium]
MKIAISGGLGFIGLRLAESLVGAGHAVAILDNLHPQIHGDERALVRARAFADVQIGDVRDPAAWDAVLDGAEAVLHMAAETGTGQSMDEVVRYADVNVTGTAALAEALGRRPAVRSVFLPSSRAIYGEGAYACDVHGAVLPERRTRAALERGDFALRCPVCRQAARPIATSEDVMPRPASVYATTKLAQELILKQYCEAKGVDLRVARYQNVYGPGQALGNPYTGVLVIFAQQIDRGEVLNIYEDGLVARDFVHVDDVVRATTAIMEAPENPGPVNVGAGKAVSLLGVVAGFAEALGRDVPYRISGDFRFGDIRHAVADVTKLRALGVEPGVDLEDGIGTVIRWLKETPSCRA